MLHNDSIGNDDWASILYYTTEGRVTFGQEQRAFIPAFFHQFHCVRGLYRSIVYPGQHDDVNFLKAPDEHVQHCLNYLRQMFLCNPSDMLEKGDFMDSTFDDGAIGSDLVCQDWELLFDEMNTNHEQFLQWNAEWD